ncbi:alpha/beta hydrolase family protein [Gordonia sp. NPDC003424]
MSDSDGAPWRRVLDGAGHRIPVAVPSARLAVHGLRDELVLIGMRHARPMISDDEFARITHEVSAALDLYERHGWLDDPETFFATPPPLVDMDVFEVSGRGRSYERFVFDSGYRPDAADPARARWMGYAGNERVYGLLLRHSEPRPWLVCVHGAEMGRAGLDLTLFRAWHLHEQFGLNVVLPVLPLHGPRGRGVPSGKAIPGPEVLDNVHFAAQAVWDVRRLLSWIRNQDPSARTGLNGISMGGYVSALVGSLDTDLTCAILGVPVANLLELLTRHSGINVDDPRGVALRAGDRLGAMTSPLSLTPRVPMRGRFIYGGVADRVVSPRDQVELLWKHWGEPEIVWYQGGHTGFFRARPVQRFIDAAIVQSGLL